MDMSEIQLERLTRAAVLLLADEESGINVEIANQNMSWGGMGELDDPQFWASLGQTDPQAQVETIELANFYPGHVPSLIDAPIDKYPNIAVLTYRADSLPSTDDWAEQFTVNLAIEVMCKAEGGASRPAQEEDARAAELVNMRTNRTLAAAHKVMMSSAARNFMSLVPKIGNTPNVLITDVFVRHEEKGRGPRWFWQGARLDYRIQQWVNY
jgi:hypothetical protein